MRLVKYRKSTGDVGVGILNDDQISELQLGSDGVATLNDVLEADDPAAIGARPGGVLYRHGVP